MVRRTLLMLAVAFAAGQMLSEKTEIFVCGQDKSLGSPIVLHWVNLVLAGDSRRYVPCPALSRLDSPHPPEHRENREDDLISRGVRSKDLEEQWRAAQARVRLSSSIGVLVPRPFPDTYLPACNAEIQDFGQAVSLRRWFPGTALRLMRNGNIALRKEAAYALAVAISKPNLEAEVLQASLKELHACWLLEADPDVQGLLLEVLGVVSYQDAAQADAAQVFLTKEGRGLLPRVLGAVKGLEALFRLNPQLPAREETRIRLRQLVANGVQQGKETDSAAVSLRIKRLALMALQATRDTDSVAVEAAAIDADWQVRRLIAARLNLAEAKQGSLAAQLALDPVFQVRYEFLGPLAREATRTGVCKPIIEYLKDESPAVVMRAMDSLVATCTDLDDAKAMLIKMAEPLKRPEDGGDWRVPSRALAAVARVEPDSAKPLLAVAAKYPVWQVRATAAALSVTLADEAVAVSLAGDPEPNVKTAALQALAQMKHPAVVPQAIDVLNTAKDYQLLRMAAMALEGLPAEAKEDATTALLSALRRVTEEETDTSRETRIAFLQRLAETLPPERSSDLLTYTSDYDDAVIVAARRAFENLVGVPPAGGPKRRRYPYQPAQTELADLPTEAEIRLEPGTVTIRFMLDVAPVTVARFAALANAKFYNNSSFYRVVPGFVAQSGGPGGNELSATSRFMRDEVGPQAAHLRGVVSMSSRGTDTGDGQFFFDLVDLPNFDRDYTVFAYVTKGMEIVDQLLEGAKIVSVTVK